MKKIKSIIIFIVTISILLALGIILLQLYYNNLSDIVVIVTISICLFGILSTFHIWNKKLNKLERISFKLEYKHKLNSTKTRKILRFSFLILMYCNFHFFFHSQINNYYAFIFVILYLIINVIFLTQQLLVINSDTISHSPRWKIKWSEICNYSIDYNSRTLKITEKNGQTRIIPRIRHEDLPSIEILIKKHLSSKEN